MADKDSVMRVIRLLLENWPREEMSEARAGLYCRLLTDIPGDILEAACLQCVATSRFFPTVAELRDAALALTPQVSGLPDAGEAWGEVCFQIRRTGSWGKPEFSHPLIGKAVDGMGGWKMLCMSEDPMPDRAHFLKVYDALARRCREERRVLPQVRALTAQLANAQLPALEASSDRP